MVFAKADLKMNLKMGLRFCLVLVLAAGLQGCISMGPYQANPNPNQTYRSFTGFILYLAIHGRVTNGGNPVRNQTLNFDYNVSWVGNWPGGYRASTDPTRIQFTARTDANGNYSQLGYQEVHVADMIEASGDFSNVSFTLDASTITGATGSGIPTLYGRLGPIGRLQYVSTDSNGVGAYQVGIQIDVTEQRIARRQAVGATPNQVAEARSLLQNFHRLRSQNPENRSEFAKPASH